MTPARRMPVRRPLLTRRKSPEQRWVWVGDANPSILVAGHSHRSAYRDAIAAGLTSAGTRVAVLGPEGPVDPSAPPPAEDRTYWSAACDAPGQVLAVVWTGNQHNKHFLFEFDEPLRLHDSAEPGRVVPASMISALWESELAGIEIRVPSARAEHFVFVGTPPPKAEEDIRAGLRGEPRLLRAVAAAGESVDTIRITPASVRVGLWKILQNDLEERAARVGATFVPVPDTAKTADGCLRPEYSAGDSSHANAAFGALMLREIEAAVVQEEAARR